MEFGYKKIASFQIYIQDLLIFFHLQYSKCPSLWTGALNIDCSGFFL